MTAREAYAHLVEQGVEFFTTAELARYLGIAGTRANGLAHRMAKTGFAKRVRRGLYAVVPPADWRARADVLPQNWYLAGAALAGATPYFLAYYTAMEIHGMTQNPLTTIFIAIQKQRREIHRHKIRFRFVTVPPRMFFGFEDKPIERGQKVAVADLERTFIDAIDRPDLCGGLEEAFRGYTRRVDRLDRHRLVAHAQRFGRQFPIKRLGFLLEAAGVRDARLLWDLERIAGRAKDYVLLDKTQGHHEGQRNKRWQILVNTDLDRLIEAART